jgi:hypothetical protein
MSAEWASFRAVSEPRWAGATPRFIVGAMMTPSHSRFGARLAASCLAHSLPLALFELPYVHRSISPHGVADLAYTKPHFVQFLLQRYRLPVLYVDVDCVIAQQLTIVEELLARNVDFAVYNWLAEEHTECYVRAEFAVTQGQSGPTPNRFYRFSHSVDQMSMTQLVASGAVQWYNDTEPARRLLARWQSVIEQSPCSADDPCLDFAFNHYPSHEPPLTAAWLQKRYARYAWWIYERPVIDHPEFPRSGAGFVRLDTLQGKPRIRMNLVQTRSVEPVFPRDCLIDTQTRQLLRIRNGEWVAAGPMTVPLWISDGAHEGG